MLGICWIEGGRYGQKGVFSGADHQHAPGGGSPSQSIDPVAEVYRKLGISEQTCYSWRKKYGGMRVDQTRRLKELEQENSRLKKLVADLSLDNAILKVVNRGNF